MLRHFPLPAPHRKTSSKKVVVARLQELPVFLATLTHKTLVLTSISSLLSASIGGILRRSHNNKLIHGWEELSAVE
ncbi:hypothetical protein C2S53_000861 [Perilla frutescens var. hirtella]|uniref:Uncharacterized protein n=1 Tax=Perilla frutescens var. hirtella TaxID=608512 RepID=A0AAD4JPR5_PERFH|nr:hypothetical protein C2S53_000861 [Perilla frutescens var. hirtella]